MGITDFRPRAFYSTKDTPHAMDCQSYTLKGFCDASQKAYSAVVYIQAREEDAVYSQIICSETRVAPVKKMTIPRLELLSALLLARLISTVRHALETEVELEDIHCYTDSQVALFWITGTDKEWKQFVMNRVIEIRSLLPPSCWRHCPGTQNPADIPSRGVSSQQFQDKMMLWLHGPSLATLDQFETVVTPPRECLTEMRTRKDKSTTALITQVSPTVLLLCEDYSCLKRLIRVTAYILKFIDAVRAHRVCEADLPTQVNCTLTAGDLHLALMYWIKVSQSSMLEMRNFDQWKTQFGLYQDDFGIWHCGGRLGNADMLEQTKQPILNRDHHLTLLIVRECHKRVMHGGVKATLTEIRSKYWIVQGRSFIRGVLRKCTLCHRFQGRPYAPPPAPPLPSFRVKEARPFAHNGVDFTGPLYVQDTIGSSARKVWLCLYTCCATRAVHLNIFQDMTTETFIRCFRRFVVRRGFPALMISDNAKTFKAASRAVASMAETSAVRTFLSTLGIKWAFNVEKAPWWGGFFERMIQTAKRCLRKTIGRACLTCEELLTTIVEIEMTLNSRPLSYISSEDLEEPLTPSHLLCGHRILSLPDPVADNLDHSTTHNDLTRRMQHLSKILTDFWKRWRSEYLMELWDMHRHFKPARGVDSSTSVGDVVVIHDENLPRGLRRLGTVEELMVGADGNIRCVKVKVTSRDRNSTSIRRPLQRLYPLELCSEDESERSQGDQTDSEMMSTTLDQDQDESVVRETVMDTARTRRQAFRRAQDNMRAWYKDL